MWFCIGQATCHISHKCHTVQLTLAYMQIVYKYKLQMSGPLEQRSEQEVFYSCPSTSAEAFFEAVSSQMAGLETSTYAATPSTQLKQAIEVAQAVQASSYCYRLAIAHSPCAS